MGAAPTYCALFSLLVATNLALSFHRATDDSCSEFHVDQTQCQPYLSFNGETTKPPLLVVSLDGFRSDYLERLAETSKTNGLLRLARCGVKAASMIPVFPTVTLPNHYSIVTGLYPESHGIVAHEFYDPELGRNFSLPAAGFSFSDSNLLDPVWWTGEPIWYTIKRQGKKSAAFFWPGSYIDDSVRRPDYWLPYDGNVPFKQRISQVIDWLQLPQPKRPSFIGLYLEEPDGSGHNNGPLSPLVDEQIQNVDHQIELLLNSMSANGLLGCVDIIILSDHGMASVPLNENVVKLEDMVKDIRSSAYCFDCAEGLTPTLLPVNDSQRERDRIASNVECRNEDVRIYDKWDFPRRHHYADSRRISSLLFDLSIHWRVIVGTEDYLPGGHGWDNIYPDMAALFVAQGPSFRHDGATVDSFYNIELYNLMCLLADVEPAPNNGTWGALHHLLAKTPPELPDGKDFVAAYILDYPLNSQGQRVHYIDDQKRRRVCDLLSGNNDPRRNLGFNLTDSYAKQLVVLHVPWGLPGTNKSGVKVLVSSDFVIGFNVQDGIPSWVSYTVSKSIMESNDSLIPSWRADPRLRVSDVSICDRLKENPQSSSLLLAPLFFPRLSSSLRQSTDAWVETNAIEISPSFEKYWENIEDMIVQLSANLPGRLNIFVGSVRDSPSPAIFLVVSYCPDPVELLACLENQLNVQSFILPTHLHYSRDCLSTERFLRSHLTTIRDVERASGFNLFQSLLNEAKVQLLRRTILASSLLVDPLDPLVYYPSPIQTFGSITKSFRKNHAIRLGNPTCFSCWIFGLFSVIFTAILNNLNTAVLIL